MCLALVNRSNYAERPRKFFADQISFITVSLSLGPIISNTATVVLVSETPGPMNGDLAHGDD